MTAPPTPPGRSKRNRAAARRNLRATPAHPAATATVQPGLPAVLTALWWTATVLFLFFTARSLDQKITWYLAVDQYGYLAFSHDLMRGHVFHHWPPLDAFVSRMPQQVDVLVQTYIYDHGKLYCRYAPGFPIILAAWRLLFGDGAAHSLNPTIFTALLVLMIAFARRIFRSAWRGTAAAVLLVLFPSNLHLWGITLVRDLSTHLFAVLGLYLLLPARGRRLGPWRTAAAGAALGYAASVRPDAVLYLIPAVSVAGYRWYRERPPLARIAAALGTGALGLLLGLSPFMAYNWLATGNPLRPTQGMEVQDFLPSAAPTQPPTPTPPAGGPGVGYPSGAWKGGTAQAIQGGGLRLDNLPRILPGNLRLLRSAYGDVLLWVGIWGAVVALLQRRILFFATVPYMVPALLFYSCWGRPDARYLSGLYIMMPLLILEGTLGTLDLFRRLVRRGRVVNARQLALVVGLTLFVATAVVRVPSSQSASALPWLSYLIPGITIVAILASATWPTRRVVRVAAPVLALVLVGLGVQRATAASQSRAAFQKAQMLRAQATFARVVEPRAVVITTEDVGRPAENIDYYSGVAHALYLTDLERWRLSVTDAARLLAQAGWVPYLFVPPTQPGLTQMLQDLRSEFTVDQVASVSARDAMWYFVAAPFHRGVAMEMYRIRRSS